MNTNKVIYAALAIVSMLAIQWLSTIPATYAHGCDSTGVPPFKDFPGASGPTGNPHTCEQPTRDPHDDLDNPDTGNPHNT
jgi:hypothetical protein